MLRAIVLLLIFFGVNFCTAQNTVGVLSLDRDNSQDGYNLIFPHNQSDVYLIDACGQVVHEWKDSIDFRPGNSVYLNSAGELIKCKRLRTSAVNDHIWAGGAGETIEIVSWENDFLASFTLNDSLYRLHHDIAPMPNGNILMILWEFISKNDALAAGRTEEMLPDDKVWSLAVFEWDPDLDSIVWEWHAWDHLIQDQVPGAGNFGDVAKNPNKIDVNYGINGLADWLHTNAINYNPILDQIVLSVPHFHEFWIIDHSLSTEEAATSSGGNANKGGDLLYRWGNPLSYEKGDSSDRKLYFQHDVHWTRPNAQEGDSNFGEIILFNNRRPDLTSSVEIIQTPLNNYNYDTLENGAFGPIIQDNTFTHPSNDVLTYSTAVSSAQLLPNENVLVMSGRWGFAYEITPEEQVVWEYRVPFLTGMPVSQGDTLSIGNNLTFRMTRYPIDDPAFSNRTLSPMGYLELNPNIDYCEQLSSINDFASFKSEAIKLFPNPTSGLLNIESLLEDTESTVMIYNIDGSLVSTKVLRASAGIVDMGELPSGMYFIKLGEFAFQKVVKL